MSQSRNKKIILTQPQQLLFQQFLFQDIINDV